MANEDASATEVAATEAPAEQEVAATEEPAAEEAAATEASGFAALVAAADVDEGEKVYRKCAACHVVGEEVNRVGPHMYGIVGREIGGVDDFKYSDALAEMGGVWDVDALNAWLENPKEFAPGNKMSFRGLNKEEERAAVIRYMESVSE
ncbi:MAG: cytochrome c family protein [Rhodobacteraceae bacterium]|nr:cytochrome c family protein [Paracoccaceae bacterium]